MSRIQDLPFASAVNLTNEAGDACEAVAVPARKPVNRRNGFASARPASRSGQRLQLDAMPVSSVHLCIAEDQLCHFPRGQQVPTWPASAPAPRTGEVVYLTSTTAWAVRIVVHELVHGCLRTEVWLDWIGASRHARSPDVTDSVH